MSGTNPFRRKEHAQVTIDTAALAAPPSSVTSTPKGN